jgi:two-component system, cell cycle response regulator
MALLNANSPDGATRRAATEIARAALEASSAETAEHSDDVVTISEALCDRLGVAGSERDDIVVAARLHDIGKVAVPREILEKPGSLTPTEWAAIRRHTVVGEQILRAVPEMAPAAKLVRHSHERWDGDGYPDRLAGDEIPLGSRIIFCADAFHAIRSDRSYRAGVSAPAALDEIVGCASTQFDPDVVMALELTARDLHRHGRRLGRSNRL